MAEFLNEEDLAFLAEAEKAYERMRDDPEARAKCRERRMRWAVLLFEALPEEDWEEEAKG